MYIFHNLKKNESQFQTNKEVAIKAIAKNSDTRNEIAMLQVNSFFFNFFYSIENLYTIADGEWTASRKFGVPIRLERDPYPSLFDARVLQLRGPRCFLVQQQQWTHQRADHPALCIPDCSRIGGTQTKKHCSQGFEVIKTILGSQKNHILKRDGR